MPTLLEKLGKLLKNEVSGEASAAVAVVLKTGTATPSVLLVKRRIDERDPWSGQIAFPGGRFRPGDGALEETVRRELWEEVGLGLGEELELLGAMPALSPANAPSLVVQPFLCLLRSEADIVLGPELSKYLWAGLGDFRRRAGYVFASGRREVRSVPIFLVGSEVVWGLTANILRRLFEALEPIPIAGTDSVSIS